MGFWWCSRCSKAWFLARLRRRSGFASVFSIATPFVFESEQTAGAPARWKNLDQLEAVVEFYLNYRPKLEVLPAGRDRWGDAWAPNAEPLDPESSEYVRVDFGIPQGSSAELVGGAGSTTLKLDGDPDLREIVPNPRDADNDLIPGATPEGYPPARKYLYDTIRLDGDTARDKTKLYRIMSVSHATKLVELDAPPNLGGKASTWHINRRPALVLIDAFGARQNGAGPVPAPGSYLRGAAAIPVTPDPAPPGRTTLRLDGAVALDRVNPQCDTIYLPDDSAAQKPAATYRIVAVNPGAREVTVFGRPTLPAAGSPWHIPAGVSGLGPALRYNLGPPVPGGVNPPARSARGSDHYDGVLFIVHRAEVVEWFRWSTYTSRDYGGGWNGGGNWREKLTSLRGNARYYYTSYRSGGSFKNYTLSVIDATNPHAAAAGQSGLTPHPPHDLVNHPDLDAVEEARYYFGTPVPPAAGPAGDALVLDTVQRDANGKGLIRLHRGSANNGVPGGAYPNGRGGTGSEGCLVAVDYVAMRTALARLFQEEYRQFYGRDDPEVRKLIQYGATNAGSEDLYGGAAGPANDIGLAHENWADKLVGPLYLVRPDERPLG